MWGGPVALAYAVQAAVSISVAIATVLLWRSNARMAQKSAALCIAMLLTTPYALDYDMMELAPAIALLASDGLAHGYRPNERTLIAALWFVPFVARECRRVHAHPARRSSDAAGLRFHRAKRAFRESSPSALLAAA